MLSQALFQAQLIRTFSNEKRYCSLPPLASWIHIQSKEKSTNSQQFLLCPLLAPTLNYSSAPHQPLCSGQDARQLRLLKLTFSQEISKTNKKNPECILILLLLLIFKPHSFNFLFPSQETEEAKIQIGREFHL